MHSKGIAHRDLKVENIMIHGDGSLKICDFGLATTEERVKSRTGTELYMAPEILEFVEHDPKQADIFSLGILLFAMKTCFFPFRKAHPEDKVYRLLLDGDYDRFWQIQNWQHEESLCLSENLKDLIIQMLSYNPEQRPDFEAIRSHPWFTNDMF